MTARIPWQVKAAMAPTRTFTPVRSGLLQRKCACGGTPGPSGECEECSKKKRLGLQAKLKVNKPGDIYEQEADRVAEAIVNGKTTGRPPISSLGSGSAVQRQEAAKPKTEEEKYKEAAKKVGEAFLETAPGKEIKKKAEELGDAFIATLPGKIITGAGVAGAIATLAATHKELPIGIPEIPLDKIKPGLKMKITYDGPVDKPTKVMATFSFTLGGARASGKKPALTESQRFQAETARMAAEQAKFREGLKTNEEKAAEKRMFDAYLRSRMLSPEQLTPRTQPLSFGVGGEQLGFKPLTPSGRALGPWSPPFRLTGEAPATESATKEEPKKKEEESLQRKAVGDREISATPPVVDEVLQSSGQSLDATTRAFMEQRFGHDFSQVRVHTDAKAAESVRTVNAVAYTVGHNVVFGAGQHAPESGAGQRLLAHELAHVVQQSRGGPTPLLNPESPLEQAAAHAADDVVNRSAPVSVAGASRQGIARQPYKGDVPINLFEDLDVSKMTPDARKQMIANIDARLRYLDSQAKKPTPPVSGITVPGLSPVSLEAERSQLFDWRKKLESGTGTVVAHGIPRSSPPQALFSPTPTGHTGVTSKSQEKKKVVPRAHVSPPLKPSPVTLEDYLALANVDPHQASKKPAPSMYFPPPSPQEKEAVEEYLRAESAGKSEEKKKDVPRAHVSPPLKPSPVTLEDYLALANVDPHQASKPAPTVYLPSPSPEEKKAMEEYLRPRQPGEVVMPDGQKVIIPPKPPGELTEDITFEGSVLAKANVQGVRASVVHNLSVELRRIEGNAESSRWAAQRFLSDWPIMRGLADLAASATPPPASIWRAVDKYIQQSREAIRQGDLEKAVGWTKQANDALRSAQSAWGYYKDRNLGGAENIKSAAEGTRDAAKYTLIALAVVASGGIATIVATAGGIAIDATDVLARAASGEKINWGEVTAEIAVQVVTAKFGGKLSGGLLKALEKNPAAQGLERQILMKAIEGVMTGAESRTLGAVIRGAFQSASEAKEPLTWDQFINQVTDPKSVIIDITIGVARGIKANQAAVLKGTKPLIKGSKATKTPSTPPTDPYDVEAWNKYYEENPNAARSVGAAAKDDPAAFGPGKGSKAARPPRPGVPIAVADKAALQYRSNLIKRFPDLAGAELKPIKRSTGEPGLWEESVYTGSGKRSWGAKLRNGENIQIDDIDPAGVVVDTKMRGIDVGREIPPKRTPDVAEQMAEPRASKAREVFPESEQRKLLRQIRFARENGLNGVRWETNSPELKQAVERYRSTLLSDAERKMFTIELVQR